MALITDEHRIRPSVETMLIMTFQVKRLDVHSYLCYKISLTDSSVVIGTRGPARMHEVDTSAANYETSTALFDIAEPP